MILNLIDLQTICQPSKLLPPACSCVFETHVAEQTCCVTSENSSLSWQSSSRMFALARDLPARYLSLLESTSSYNPHAFRYLMSAANYINFFSSVPAGFVAHPIIPDDLMTNHANMHADFLDFPAIEVPSAEENTVRYFAVVKMLGPDEEKWAVVRTLDGCDVECSTEGCRGLFRLRPMELCQIAHYTSGEREGLTFVTHAAAECTPMPSEAVSRVPSLGGSRRGSRAQSRAQSPDPG